MHEADLGPTLSLLVLLIETSLSIGTHECHAAQVIVKSVAIGIA